jgi:UDP-glucose:(heptosyl)LPS alpha-1,3-glucosyltransferase
VDFVVISGTLSPDLVPLVARWHRVWTPRRPYALKFVSFFVLAGLRVAVTRADLVHCVGAVIPNRIDLSSAHYCVADYREATGAIAPRQGPRLHRWNRALSQYLMLLGERWCYRPGRTRLIGAVFDALGARMAGHYPGVQVAVTPDAVDVESFKPSASDREAFRRERGVPESEAVALFVGGFWDLKGLALAIRGVALARRRCTRPLRLWVVGRGDEARFRALAAACGVAGEVSFLGHRADVARVYQSADIFVLPSTYETFSLVACEAAASGLPIVATRVGCIEELVGDSAAGLIVEGSAGSVAEALARLAGSPDLARRMGAEARRRVRRFSWDESVESVLDAYGRLLVSSPHELTYVRP